MAVILAVIHELHWARRMVATASPDSWKRCPPTKVVRTSGGPAPGREVTVGDVKREAGDFSPALTAGC